MESEGSLPKSQKPATCPYSEPDRSSLRPHPTSRRSIIILSSHLGLVFQVVSFPQVFLLKPCIPRLLAIYLNMINFLRWGVVSTSPNYQAGGPHLVACLRLLIQYIRSYPPCLKAVHPQIEDLPCHGDRDQFITLTGTHLSRTHRKYWWFKISGIWHLYTSK